MHVLITHARLHTPSAAPAGWWCPEETAGFLSRILFLWVGGLIRLGYAKALDAADLWDMASADSAAAVSDMFAWNLSSATVVAALSLPGSCAGLRGRLLFAARREGERRAVRRMSRLLVYSCAAV